MKAIQIKYLGPTDTMGSRWKAWVEYFGGHTVPYDHALNFEANARLAAQGLIDKHELNWRIARIDTLPNGDYVASLGGEE
jgi:hypothetical protein